MVGLYYSRVLLLYYKYFQSYDLQTSFKRKKNEWKKKLKGGGEKRERKEVKERKEMETTKTIDR